MSFSKLIVCALLSLLTLIVPRVSHAQTNAESWSGRVNLNTSQNLFAAVEQDAPGSGPHLAITDFAPDVQWNRTAWAASQASAGNRQRSAGRKVVGGILGGVGGFFAGGYLGALIEGDRCHCDDPGLMGALIGAPVGAAVGAILGVKFF